MRVALLAPPLYPIPPLRYAGTERVVAALGAELHRRGHDVTLIGAGDSDVPYRVIPTVERALWPAGFRGDVRPYLRESAAVAAAHLDEFDLVHSHLEGAGLALADASPTPVLSTFHGRLDTEDTPTLLARHTEAPLVAISASQCRWYPDNNWRAVVAHGLPFADLPLDPSPSLELLVIGRATHEKGIVEAIDLARRTGRPLTVAAKAVSEDELSFVETYIRPAERDGTLTFLGEVTGAERDERMVHASATLMLGAWPEPFGLVAIESLALGTPVIARRSGALPEIVEHGVDGFLVDDVEEAQFALARLPQLDRAEIRRRARERFSAARMADRYEAVYQGVLDAEAMQRTVIRPRRRLVLPAPPVVLARRPGLRLGRGG